MKYFDMTYSIGNQQTIQPFPETLEGLKSALRAAAKRERMGWKVSPSQIQLKHLIENWK